MVIFNYNWLNNNDNFLYYILRGTLFITILYLPLARAEILVEENK